MRQGEHWRDTRRVKEAIHVRLHPDNFNRDSGIEIPEAWTPTIKKHNNRRAVRQRTAEGANHCVKQQGSKYTNQSFWKTTNHSRASCLITSRMTSRPHRLKRTSSMQSKRRDLHHTWLHRQTRLTFTTMKNHSLFYEGVNSTTTLNGVYLAKLWLSHKSFHHRFYFLVFSRSLS